MNKLDFLSIITHTITKFIPKKRNRWVFGAWFGESVSDNTKALSDYIENYHPEIEMIWITNKPEKLNFTHGKALKRNSLRSLPYIMTSKVAIMNQGYGDLNACDFIGGSFRVQLWHGVAWKKIFKDAINPPHTLGEKLSDKLFDYINSYDLYISPSHRQSAVMHTAFNINDSKILLCGQPRNVVLFSDEFRKQARKKLFNEIDETEKKLIVYMPTFRDKKVDIFSFGKEEHLEKLQIIQKKYNFVLIEKSHYAAQKKITNTYQFKGGVFFLPDENAETLLAAADILITDYSSCFFDFLITDRPIIHFIYDYDYYINDDRGVYYDKESVVCGDCPETIEELFDSIVKNLKMPDKDSDLRKKRREEYITYENDESCETIYAEIVRKE